MKVLAFSAAVAVSAFAQDWPTYNGDYSGRRYSPLAQINQSNIDSLSLAWVYRRIRARAAGGGGNAAPVIKGTPIEINGVLYLTDPGSRVGRGCAHRPRDLALRVEIERRLAHRQSRRGGAGAIRCTSKRRIAIWSR